MNTMFSCWCILWGEFKLWWVLGVNGFILVPLRILLNALNNFMQLPLYLFLFISLCKRNIQCIKYKNYVDFHRLSPYSKDSREMQTELILWGLQCLFLPARAKLIIFAADSVLFHVSNPHPLNKLVSSLWLNLFHCLPFSMCFPHTSSTPFHICASLFSTSFCSILFFNRAFPSHLYAHFFHRPQLYSSARFIRRDYLLVCFIFHSSQSSRSVRILTTHKPPYSSRVVIMPILSMLGWCPLNVISNKISVFLSTDSQSTGSLSFKSHVPVLALLSLLNIIAVRERKSSLHVSAT